jgi:hypothetical protein
MPKRAGLWAVLLAVSFATSCSEEGPILRRFFTAVQTKDSSTLAAISAATFPWVIKSWELVGTQSDTTEPFALHQLEREAAEVQQRREKLVSDYGKFRVKNIRALKVIEARLEKDPDCTFAPKLAAVHEELLQYRDGLKALEVERRALTRKAHRERTIARMSLMGAITDIDEFDGDVSVKKVLVAISGEDGTKSNYLVTLCRYNLANRENNFRPRAVWIITEFEEGAG